MRPSEAQEIPDTAPQTWSPFWLAYELIGIGAAFGALSTLMAIEVWKKAFDMISPNAP